MEDATFFILAFLCGLASSSPVYNGDKFYFRHSRDSLDQRSPAMLMTDDAPDADTLREQGSWIQKYHHARMPNKNTFSSAEYELENPEELRWLIENHLEQQQEPRPNPMPQYSQEILNKNLNNLKFDFMYKENPTDVNDEFDYMDAYDEHQTLPQSAENEDNFQQALKEYILQQSKKGEKSKAQLKPSNPKEFKKMLDEAAKKPLSTSSSTTTSTPLILEERSPTITPTSESPLDLMPPVALGKGQKEYPMFRPATENRRKFDHWAESLQKSMVNELNGIRNLRSVAGQKQEKDYPVDSLTEELNKLKIPSQRGAKNPVWF